MLHELQKQLQALEAHLVASRTASLPAGREILSNIGAFWDWQDREVSHDVLMAVARSILLHAERRGLLPKDGILLPASKVDWEAIADAEQWKAIDEAARLEAEQAEADALEDAAGRPNITQEEPMLHELQKQLQALEAHLVASRTASLPDGLDILTNIGAFWDWRDREASHDVLMAVARSILLNAKRRGLLPKELTDPLDTIVREAIAESEQIEAEQAEADADAQLKQRAVAALETIAAAVARMARSEKA